MRVLTLTVSCAAMALTSPTLAQEAMTNPQIDYDGFVALATNLADVREKHRLPLGQFLTQAREEGAILLDTRSAAAFAEGHLEGAINLPFSDFTAESLAKVIGKDTRRPIFIYCNNNFSDDIRPVVAKKATLALNIPTFINLHGYGYTNVWELAGVVGTADTSWVDAKATAQNGHSKDDA